MDWNAECVLVTGAAGFIGAHTARALITRGARVVGVDNFDPFYERARKERNLDWARGGAEPDAFAFREMDIVDQGALTALMRERGVTGVIHLAAKAGVRPSIEDPLGYARANVVGTQAVLGAASGAGCVRAVCASSSSVYGNNDKTPFAEDDPVERPISPYAATKRACELIAHTHHHLTRLPVAMLRFFTVFGPGQRPDLAIEHFLGRVGAGGTITMFGDGTTSRDYTYIDDIVAGVLAGYGRIDDHGYRIWNLGGDRPTTLNDLIATIGAVTGREPIVERAAPQPGDVDRTWADLTRSRAELGYAPATSLRAGIERQWAARLEREGAR